MKKPESNREWLRRINKSDLPRIDRMKDSDIDYSDIPPIDYLRHIGQKGGKVTGGKKAESSRKNLEKGRAARKPKPKEER